MDRQKKDDLPKMQVGFIDFVCMPLYEVLADLVPELVPLLDGVKSNKAKWQLLASDSKGWLSAQNLCDTATSSLALNKG